MPEKTDLEKAKERDRKNPSRVPLDKLSAEGRRTVKKAGEKDRTHPNLTATTIAEMRAERKERTLDLTGLTAAQKKRVKGTTSGRNARDFVSKFRAENKSLREKAAEELKKKK